MYPQICPWAIETVEADVAVISSLLCVAGALEEFPPHERTIIEVAAMAAMEIRSVLRIRKELFVTSANLSIYSLCSSVRTHIQNIRQTKTHIMQTINGTFFQFSDSDNNCVQTEQPDTTISITLVSW